MHIAGDSGEMGRSKINSKPIKLVTATLFGRAGLVSIYDSAPVKTNLNLNKIDNGLKKVTEAPQ